MKNFFLFIAATLATCSAYAKGDDVQSMVTGGPVFNGHIPHVGGYVVNSGTNPTTPAQASLRLVAKTHTAFNGLVFMPVDSITYRYDGDRPGLLNNDNIDNDEPLLYSESVSYTYDAAGGGYINKLRRLQDYFQNNSIKFLTYQPWKGAEGIWKDSSRFGYTYDNNGKMVASTFEQYYANMWTNSVTSAIIYTGQVVSAVESPVYKVAFQYDNASKLVEVVDEQNIAGVWQYKERSTYEYAGQDVVRHTKYTWNPQSANWVGNRRWEYTYAGSQVTTETELEWNGSGWINSVQHVYTYDASQNMTEEIVKVWNAAQGTFVESTREQWEYNSYNVPTVITTATWNGSAWAHTATDKQYRLYYEAYFPTSIPGGGSIAGMNVYPVPATDVVNIDMNFARSQDLAIALVDVKGTVHASWTETAVSSLHKAVPVSHLAPGVYFIKVAAAGEHFTERILVSH